jgi:hypothetical protein
MALLYITEYIFLGAPPANGGQIPQEPPVAEQTVAITGASIQSNPFNPVTRFIRLHSDAPAEVLVGANPTAILNTSGRMAANQTEYRALPLPIGTNTFKVAVIAPTV